MIDRRTDTSVAIGGNADAMPPKNHNTTPHKTGKKSDTNEEPLDKRLSNLVEVEMVVHYVAHRKIAIRNELENQTT